MFFFGVAEEAHSFHPHWSPYQRDNLTAPFGFSSHHAFSFFMVWEFFKFLNFVSILMKEKFIFKPLVLSYFAVASKRKQAKKPSMYFLERVSVKHLITLLTSSTIHKHQDTNTMQPCFLLLQNTNDLSSISSIISFYPISLSSFPSKTPLKWPSPLISLPTFCS